MRRPTAVLLAVAMAAAVPSVLAVPASAAPPAGACRDPEPGRSVIADLPWAQQLLDLGGAWRHSTGAGVVVAVVDSGVDADHPQLRGRVLAGQDFFLVGDLRGNFDCVSHGTAVGSIVAARAVNGVGFRGVAPGAQILPIRVTDRELNDQGEPTPIDPAAVGQGIRYAADRGAKVINLSLSGYGDFPAVRNAVRYARSKDALVVAAVGNRADRGPATSYPAAYPGVLGVGAIDIAGARSSGSQVGDYLDLVAPGAGVVGATRVRGHAYHDGTSFAAPFVAGTAALVRSAWPDLTADQVAQRLMATAAPARGGRASREYGAGVVDPYRAVTEGLSEHRPLGMPEVVPAAADREAVRAAAWWDRTSTSAKLGAGAAAGALTLAAVLAWAVPRGRRRRWLPGRAEVLPAVPPRDEPPEEIFLFPPPPVEEPARR
ncbi:type VII secretion-associated serine protease mycosin [Plantactinospora sp. CA-290183]|uniref:type VII secretion-associated serine protease mycosin n=1 Tax=Plantactinospora sp. CA-290183 TaxID=3240006 RepID=UPI003D949197